MTAGLMLAEASLFDTVLKPVDGPRGTWSWMLHEGIHGYGLIPWIVDLDCWACSGPVFNRTMGRPVVTPAVAKWSVIHDHEMFETLFVRLEDIVAPGGFDVNNMVFDEYTEEVTSLMPIWAVTPIDDVTYFRWKIPLTQAYKEFTEDVVAAYSCHGSDYHDEDCPAIDVFSDKCSCGLSASLENIHTKVCENTVCPPIYDDLVPAWEWGVGRWVDGWNAIQTKSMECELEEPYCLCSLSSQQSPWGVILPSERLAQEKERLSSIPLMSSQQSLESWERSSPQLTLFDM